MIESIIGIILGLGVSMFCMVRSWQSYRKPGDIKASRVVSLIMSIIYGLNGTYMSLYVWYELMEVL